MAITERNPQKESPMPKKNQSASHGGERPDPGLQLVEQGFLSGAFRQRKSGLEAGIDEAGRGCLAGPVVAAAVILPPDADLPGLADSKVLSAPQRAGLAARIGMVAVGWGLGVVWPAEIDRTDILRATFKAMSRAVATLRNRPSRLLVDGKFPVPEAMLREALGGAVPAQRAIVDGDALVPAISAASIIAKTFRDNLMEKLDIRYPGYDFAKHKGYGTREHLEALRRLGPCRMHRMTFKGVRPEAASLEQGSLW